MAQASKIRELLAPRTSWNSSFFNPWYHTYLCTCGSVLLIVAIYLASGDIAIAAQPSACASNIVWTGILRGIHMLMGTLSKHVFERRTSTGSEAFSLFICVDANKLVLLSFFPLLKTIYPRVSTKPLPNDSKSPLPVDVRRSKTLLLKLPNVNIIHT